MATSALFSPFTIRALTLRNRVVVSPMCQYSSVDGFATDWHLVHLGSRAVGGAAAVLTEATAVLPEGRISPDDLGIWKDEQVEMLARIFHFIAGQGAIPGMQLAHAGRKASTRAPWKGGKPLPPSEGGWQPILSASAIPFDDGYQIPEALDDAGIARVVRAFGTAARRAVGAGARIIELHAAHGYLLHEFLSPLSNRRDDRYGGSFENRTRILRETVEAVRAVLPDGDGLLVRISGTDWAEGGWTVEDSVALARQLMPLGADVCDCSSGGTRPAHADSRRRRLPGAIRRTRAPGNRHADRGGGADHRAGAGGADCAQRPGRFDRDGPRASARSILAAARCRASPPDPRRPAAVPQGILNSCQPSAISRQLSAISVSSA